MTSELEKRASEIRAVAATCRTINDLARKLSWTMETARYASEVLALNLPDSKLKTGPATAGQACPKPTKKQGGK
jgi:hypothetical protein